ncbi:MAG: very short patch repair endonuclease, partial [Prevotella sp.]|nr:very short patch repair endonuclease [Prevotella sp.]
IFVNGCFWHGNDCKDFVPPKTNTEFWVNKINRNKERDINVQKQLATMGWHCIVVWECELKKDSREQTLCSLEYTLNHIFLKDHEVRYLPLEQDQQLDIAAEKEL